MLILCLKYQFLTICLKSYVFPNISGYSQIAQKNCAKLIAFHAQKFAKKMCAKIFAQRIYSFRGSPSLFISLILLQLTLFTFNFMSLKKLFMNMLLPKYLARKPFLPSSPPRLCLYRFCDNEGYYAYAIESGKVKSLFILVWKNRFIMFLKDLYLIPAVTWIGRVLNKNV